MDKTTERRYDASAAATRSRRPQSDTVSDPRRANNFDLLRLLAALQVMVLHAAGHLDVPFAESTKAVLRLFPGVPIFFTISGFLIFQSYQRLGGDLRRYFFNRVVRIYPGLAGTYLLGIVLLVVFALQPNVKDLALWSAGQLTLFQFWTPDSLRSYGVGTPNGALWTIPVELQFYAVLPIICYLWRQYGIPALVVPFVFSIASYFWLFAALRPESIAYKLFMVCVPPYLFNFLIGVGIAAYFEKAKVLLLDRGIYWLLGYTMLNLLNLAQLHLWVLAYNPTTLLGIGNLIMLSMTVIALAFTYPALSVKLLGGNDISYGIYIYHMPIVNLMVHEGFVGTYASLTFAALLTTAVAMLSWRYLESYFLRMKLRQGLTGPVPTRVDRQW